jgi:hypothetical protein
MQVKLLLIIILFSVSLTPDVIGQNTFNIVGEWGMHRDRHPDGWGRHNPPYMYFTFDNKNNYTRTFLHKKYPSLIIGTYELQNDSLLILNNRVLTNGEEKWKIPSDTLLLYEFEQEEMQLRQDWDRIWSKKIIRWRHKMYFRYLTDKEKIRRDKSRNFLLEKYEGISNFSE